MIPKYTKLDVPFLDVIFNEALSFIRHMKNEDQSNTDFIEKIGARIKQLRVEKGYTSYEKFAIEKEISRMQYWRYEKGEDMRLSSLLRVTQALDISLKDFFSEGFD